MDLTSEDWEAAVTSMQYHLRKTLGSYISTYEELPHYLLRYRPVYIPDPCVPYPVIL
jgi:hypothetical protein